MTPLIAILIRAGIPARFAKAALVAGLILSVLAIGLIALKLHDNRVISSHEAAITADLAPRTTKAAEAAAEARARDTIAIANDTQGARNANAAIPDAAPTRQSIARNCARMRRLGADTSGLPACGGSDRAR